MAPKKNRNRQKKESAGAETSKSEPSSSPPLPTTSTADTSCVLPQKILMSILSRLPVKSLVRFKGVCKQWKSLVTNQEFIKIHYNRFSDAPKTWSANSQILDRSKLGLVPTKKKPILVDHSMHVDFALASCRGLICVARPLVTDRIILWNPATRLWKVLPHPNARGDEGNVAFSSVGLGCNEEGDDYKVVWIDCMKGRKMKVYADVYSSKSDSWGTVKVRLGFRAVSVNQTVEVSGNPVWIVQYGVLEMGLLRFDATKMVFESIKHPWKYHLEPVAFVDLFGDLGAMKCHKRRGHWLEGIEVVACVNKEWIVKWDIEGEAVRRLEAKFCVGYSWRKGVIVGRCMSGSMFEYDVKEESVRVFAVERGNTGYLLLNAFEESLAHVRGMAAMDLAMPAPDGDAQMKKCILEGFLTWVIPRLDGEVQVYYPLAF